ncbi:MAG: SprT family protein [Granulicatella sp.]
MKELDLQQLCQKTSKEYFHKEFQHKITYNARLKSTGGRYILKTGNIEINPKVETILGKEVLIGVIKHELCHYHLHQEGKGYRHQDREFKMLLQQVGGHRFVERMEPFRYIYSCNSCGATFHRMRKIDTKKFRCGRCRGNLVLDSTSES